MYGVCVRDGRPALIAVSTAAPAPDQAAIAIHLAGICNTDLELVAGYKGFTGVLGHEFVGQVTAVGAARDSAWVGARVVGEINEACGQCTACLRGHPRHCLHRRTVGMIRHDGAFAPALNLVTRNLHRVPSGVPDRAAVFTEPLAAALQIVEDALIAPGSRVVVLGAGKLGLLIAQVAARLDCDCVVVARRPRIQALLEGWGIAHSTADALLLSSADVVIECTGTPGGFAHALDWLRPRGTLILKSTYAAPAPLDLTRVVVNELHVIGSRCGPFPLALEWLERGLIDTEALIDTVYPLEAAEAAFAHAATPGALKVLLTCHGDTD